MKSPDPNAIIYLWYDSEFVDSRAPERTRKIIFDAEEELLGRIVFRDIRELKIVQENSQLFNADTILWYRTDLARMILIYEFLKENPDEAAVYTDFDVVPMKENELFDPIGRFHLNLYGAVSGRTTNGLLENSFFIFDGRYKQTLELFYKAIQESIMLNHKINCFGEHARFFKTLQAAVDGKVKRIHSPMKSVPDNGMIGDVGRGFIRDNISEKLVLPDNVNVYD